MRATVLAGWLFPILLLSSINLQAAQEENDLKPVPFFIASDAQVDDKELTRAPEKTQKKTKLGGEYNGLLPVQKRLVDDLIGRYNEVTKSHVRPQEFYDSLPLSVKTTFDAITQALAATKITDKNGRLLSAAVDLVDRIETVAGKIKGVRGDKQFRLYVILKPETYETLNKSREFDRKINNLIHHRGYPICFRMQGNTPNLQFSLSRDKRRADIDVDYRSSMFPFSIFNGHYRSSNSDVRAGKNYDKHINRWKGIKNWWSSWFGSTSRKANKDEKPDGSESDRNPQALP